MLNTSAAWSAESNVRVLNSVSIIVDPNLIFSIPYHVNIGCDL